MPSQGFASNTVFSATLVSLALAAVVLFANTASSELSSATSTTTSSTPYVLIASRDNPPNQIAAPTIPRVKVTPMTAAPLAPAQPAAPSAVGPWGWLAIGTGLAAMLWALRAGSPPPALLPLPSLTAPLGQPAVAAFASAGAKAPPANLTLHVYDHCPYCTRVELFLGWNGVKYQRVLYGYGDMEGPKALTGKKQLPVLQGDGVYTPPGMIGLPESLDIIAWACQEYGLVLPPATGRKDVEGWQKQAKAPIAALSRPRMIKMPYRDFQQPEDIEYAFGKWAKKTGFVAEEALAATPELLVEMEALLGQLEGMLRGPASLNPWGLGMDDIILLPDLRRLTCVKGLKWPPKVKHYVDTALSAPAMQAVSYAPWAF